MGGVWQWRASSEAFSRASYMECTFQLWETWKHPSTMWLRSLHLILMHHMSQTLDIRRSLSMWRRITGGVCAALKAWDRTVWSSPEGGSL